jgi:hypothetical protein
MMKYFSWAVMSILVIHETAAQMPRLGGRHYLDRYDSPPGAVSTSRQMGAGYPVANFYQPVSFEGPTGSQVALAYSQDFTPTQSGVMTAGLLIGPAYRLKVTEIPYHAGLEIFPTVEILDRVCPPPGLQSVFPIPIYFALEDLEVAIAGGMVTRVVYLEDPQTALPIADRPGTQRHFDVTGTDDPLHVADQLGKPVAIVRIGSRVAPSQPEMMHEFLLGSPPWVPYTPPPPAEPATPVTGPVIYSPAPNSPAQ